MSPETPPAPATALPEPTRISRRGLWLAAALGLLVVTLVVGNGIVSRSSGTARLVEATNAQAVPPVSVIVPGAGGNKTSLDLPGRLEAYARAPIYARVSGILKAYHVDIGDQVKAGQLLAEIDAPDLDQQFLQAKAAVASAQAAETLSSVTAQRWQTLSGSNTVSRQTLDEKLGDLTVKQALTRAAQAALDRLSVLTDFKRITAPFDGMVTVRNTDLGALINADSSAGLALFIISDVRKLRLNIGVPQNYAPAVPINTKVEIAVPEYPGKFYGGVVEAASRSVDAASGTTRMQVAVDNAAGQLMPGAFANVRIDLPKNMQSLSVPAGALIFGRDGLRVAVVDANSKVVLKPITISRDLGQIVEIATGLDATDRVIESPPDGLSNGDPVRVMNTDKAPAKKG